MNAVDAISTVLTAVAGGSLLFSTLQLVARQRLASRLQGRLGDAIEHTGLTIDPHGAMLLEQRLPSLLVAFIRLGRAISNLPGGKSFVRWLSSVMSMQIEHALRIADVHEIVSVQDIVGARVGLALFAMTPFLLIFLGSNNAGILFICVMTAAIGFTLPWATLNRLTTERQSEIRSALPRATDILVVGAEAGLPFDRTIDLYCERFSGTLSSELAKMRQSVVIGQRQEDAIMEMVDRLAVDDLRILMTSVLQAQRFGVPMTDILRSLSSDLKLRREQRIRADSMRAPQKMLFPMVLFLLPATFIIILGPIVLSFVIGGF